MKKQIAFFDFDGTITTKDSFLELIKFQKGKLAFYWGFFINAPFLIAYKLKIISNQKAKEHILRFFFRGEEYLKFAYQCDEFAIRFLPRIIREKALVEIKSLISEGVEVVIVSASADRWIKKWSDEFNIKLIATILEQNGGRLTGKIAGNNCYGTEKVNRIKALYDLKEFDNVYCYGDTEGDKPMLSLGTKSFYKPFR